MYRLEAPFGRYICVYCGDSAPTVDHTPPLAAVSMMSDSGVPLPECLIVPACSECNRLLSDIGIYEVDARRDYVRKKIERRYESLLKAPTWTEEELSELGRNLADTIRGDMRMRDMVRERLAWMQ